MPDFKKDIKDMLEKIKLWYVERDKNNIEELNSLLFDEDLPPVIIGTSNGEWCIGISESKNLFLSDWEGWGNVSIDLETLSVCQYGSIGRFCVNAGVEYIFKDSNEKYLSYMNLVCDIAKSDKTSLAKASEINWFLSHLLHTRGNEERHYIWDLTITGIVQIVDGTPKIRLMQFSIPVTSAFPDVRIDCNLEAKDTYEKEKFRLIELHKSSCANTHELSKIIAESFSSSAKMKFEDNQNNCFIGFDSVRRNAREFKDYLAELENGEAKFEVTAEETICNKLDKTFIFYGTGLYCKKVSIESELRNILDKVDTYKDNCNLKDALFKIRRDIAHSLKESVLSDKHVAPFRFEGIGNLDVHGELLFNYMQVSYPFNWILEQKTDAAIEL